MILAEPEDIARGFCEAWNDNDADAIANLFVPDADFVNVVALWWDNKDDIRRAHARGFEVMFTGSQMQLEKTKTRLLGKKTAVVHALWRMWGQKDPRGNKVGQRRGVFTFVVVRDDALGWRAVSAQNTDKVPGVETMVATGGSLTPTSYRHAKAEEN